MKLFRHLTVFSSFIFLFGLTAPSAQAVQQVGRDFSMPLHMQGSVSTFDCSNAPGPQVTLESVLLMEELNLELIFRNNINKDVHTHVEEFRTDVSLIQEGDEIVIPKQPVEGGTGGNPFIWIQLIDTNGNALTNEIFLGRCVQGVFPAETDFFSEVNAVARMVVEDCTNNPGPFITVDGGMSFSPGIKARFIFRNNDNPVGGPHEADAVRDVMLIPTGHTIQFPKQPVEGGAGGNPWISVRFLNGEGQPIGTETLLGRCVQLLPGN